MTFGLRKIALGKKQKKAKQHSTMAKPMKKKANAKNKVGKK